MVYTTIDGSHMKHSESAKELKTRRKSDVYEKEIYLMQLSQKILACFQIIKAN